MSFLFKASDQLFDFFSMRMYDTKIDRKFLRVFLKEPPLSRKTGSSEMLGNFPEKDRPQSKQGVCDHDGIAGIGI